MLEADIAESGDIVVKGRVIGKLHGLRFAAATADEKNVETDNAMEIVAWEIERRASRIAACPGGDIIFSDDGNLRWMGQVVARIIANEKNVLAPTIILLTDKCLTESAEVKAVNRLKGWLANHIESLLRPLVELSRDETINPAASKVTCQLTENFGHVERRMIANEVKKLDQDARADLRRHGVRFGALHVFFPLLLKPAPAALVCLLWAIRNNRLDTPGLIEIPLILAAGRTSVEVNPCYEPEVYRLCGFRILGKRAVRIDILERLENLVRPALAWKDGGQEAKPEGAFDGQWFYVTSAMLSILGTTHEDMEQTLKCLGYCSKEHPENEIFPSDANGTKKDSPDDSEATPITMPCMENAAGNITENSDKNTLEEKKTSLPRSVFLWKRESRARHHNSNHKQRQHGKNKEQFKSTPWSRNESNNPRNVEPKNVGRKINPDSPFFKLAILKDSMKTNNKIVFPEK